MVERGSSSSWKWTTISSRETRRESSCYIPRSGAVVEATSGTVHEKRPGRKPYSLPELPISVRWPWPPSSHRCPQTRRHVPCAGRPLHLRPRGLQRYRRVPAHAVCPHVPHGRLGHRLLAGPTPERLPVFTQPTVVLLRPRTRRPGVQEFQHPPRESQRRTHIHEPRLGTHRGRPQMRFPRLPQLRARLSQSAPRRPSSVRLCPNAASARSPPDAQVVHVGSARMLLLKLLHTAVEIRTLVRHDLPRRSRPHCGTL